MKSLFVGVIVLFNSMAFAQDLNFQQYRKFLMNGNQGSGNKMALQTTCTTAAGQIYRIGEKGYDTCLAAIKDQHKATEHPGPTIHIGN